MWFMYIFKTLPTLGTSLGLISRFFDIQSGIVNAEQILCYRIPPGRLGIFKKRLCRMDAGSGQMVYVYLQNPTYPRDLTGTDFSIF